MAEADEPDASAAFAYVSPRLTAAGRLECMDAFGHPLPLDTARGALIAAWIRAVVDQDGTSRRSDSPSAPGQCKRFLINTFRAVSGAYRLAAAPDAALAMPQEHNDDGRVHGIAWDLPDMESGNPFEEVAHFAYDPNAGESKNAQGARALLEQVRPGDALQMMGLYSNGARGTHTLLFTAVWDAEADTVYWCDSNFNNYRVNGVRYGVVEGAQSRTVASFSQWLLHAGCGATLYRLREDIVTLDEARALSAANAKAAAQAALKALKASEALDERRVLVSPLQ